jgi:O-antigen ligase
MTLTWPKNIGNIGWNAAVVLICTIMGVAVVKQPLLLAGAVIGAVGCTFLWRNFEVSVLTLLVIRSSLDPFGRYQLAGGLAILIDCITAVYLFGCVLLRKEIKSDGWMTFLLVWIALMGFWPIACKVGWFDMEQSSFQVGFREWLRILSYGAVYTLITQLRGRVPGPKVLNWLLCSLIVPLGVAYAQLLLPSRFLPGELKVQMAGRVFGTLGHPNTLAVYLLLMGGLAWWKYKATGQKRWLALLGSLIIPFINTNSLAGIVIAVIAVLALTLPRLNAKTLVGSTIALVLVVGTFLCTPIGQDRIKSLRDTPILNGDLSISKAVKLASVDENSFSWRIAQWSLLVRSWEYAPIFGHGLGTTDRLTQFHNASHNDFIRALAETGLVGLSLFVGLWIAFWFRLWTLWRQATDFLAQKELTWVMLAIFIATSVGMTTEHYWETTTFYFYWWTVIAVSSWQWKNSPKKESVPMFAPTRAPEKIPTLSSPPC